MGSFFCANNTPREGEVMARPAKHNWRKLYLEYCQGRYKNVTEFAKAKKLAVRPTQREFKKLQDEAEAANSEQNTLKKTTINDHNNGTEKRKRPKNDHKQHSWQNLKKQFTDWPEEKLQAYLVHVEERLAKLKEIPFEEMGQDEIEELSKLRRERRAILSDPDPEVKCHAHNRRGETCGNPVERGKRVCWVHGGAPGSGAPPGSKNALKTGEHETIWMDTLDEEELELYEQIETDPLAQINDTIRLLSFRERRMMQRIQRLKDGLTENQKRVLQERKTIKEAYPVHDEKSGSIKVVTVPRDELVVTRVEETQYRAIDDIIRIEEALTRVQEKKVKAIEAKHKIVAKHGLDIERLRIEQERLQLEKTKAVGANKDGVKDGGSIDLNNDNDLSALTDEELETLERIVLKTNPTAHVKEYKN